MFCACRILSDRLAAASSCRAIQRPARMDKKNIFLIGCFRTSTACKAEMSVPETYIASTLIDLTQFPVRKPRIFWSRSISGTEKWTTSGKTCRTDDREASPQPLEFDATVHIDSGSVTTGELPSSLSIREHAGKVQLAYSADSSISSCKFRWSMFLAWSIDSSERVLFIKIFQILTVPSLEIIHNSKLTEATKNSLAQAQCRAMAIHEFSWLILLLQRCEHRDAFWESTVTVTRERGECAERGSSGEIGMAPHSGTLMVFGLGGGGKLV
eukprot:IDg10658t1